MGNKVFFQILQVPYWLANIKRFSKNKMDKMGNFYAVKEYFWYNRWRSSNLLKRLLAQIYVTIIQKKALQLKWLTSVVKLNQME